MRSIGFTLVELLVTTAILLALTMMASGVYMGYVKSGEEHVVRNNLTAVRGALQQFYADNGRFPFNGRDLHGNQIGFLDDASSELTQGPRKGLATFPASRTRYLDEIPLDPSTNAKDWRLSTEPLRITPATGSVLELSIVTNVRSACPEYGDL